MKSDRQRVVETLFHEVLELGTTDERQGYLESRVDVDDSIKAEVLSLIDAHDASVWMLDKPLDPLAETTTAALDENVCHQTRSVITDSDVRRIGKFEIVEEIGRGGMGVVYKARQIDLEREVAIKIQLPSKQVPEEAICAFKREARAFAKLDHPNIVRIYDCELDSTPPYLVLEWLDGRDLKDVVKQDGPLPLGIAIKYALASARGLAFAHSKGVVHRDVKPQNLFLTSAGEVKLLDFGLAKLPSGGEASTTELVNAKTDSNVAGSVDFMSPEQTESLANATHKSDIYSLGCSIYWLVAGQAPFQNENKLETLLAHRESDRPRLSSVLPPQRTRETLDALLHKMMATEPEHRPQSMDDVAAQLNAMLDESIAQKRKVRKRIFASTCAASALFLFVFIIRAFLPPNYAFELSRVSDLSDVRAFAGLHDEIQQVRRWQSNFKSKSSLLARVIAATPRAATFEACMKSGGNEDLGEINKALSILHRIHTSGIPASWRKLPTSELTSHIEETLEVEQRNEIRRRVSILLGKETSKIVLERWGLEKFPSPRRPEYQDRWIQALDSAIAEDVAPIAEWYETILNADVITYAGKDSRGGEVAILFRPRWDDVIFQGKNTVASFDVIVRFPTDMGHAGQPSIEQPLKGSPGSNQPPRQFADVETGIVVYDCGFSVEADRSVRLVWNSTEANVDEPAFARALQFLGMPESFRAKNAKIAINSTSIAPSFRIEFDFVHNELPQAEGSGLFVIDTSREIVLSHDHSKVTAVTQQLPGFLLDLKSFRGFSAAFSPGDRERQIRCELTTSGLPPLDFVASFDEQWNVVLSGSPSTKVRNALINVICSRSEALSDLEARCRVGEFRIDAAKEIIEFAVAVTLPVDSPTFHASLQPNGTPVFQIPSLTERAIKEAKFGLVQKHLTRMKPKEFLSRIQVAVRRLGEVSEHVSIGNVTCNSTGNTFSLRLQIADWSELDLGTVEVNSLPQVDGLVQEMLTEKRVVAVARDQWSKGYRHPRYGRSTAELLAWDVKSRRAEVQTRVLFGGDASDVSLPIQELVQCSREGFTSQIRDRGDGPWIEMTEASLSRALEPTVNITASTFCSAVANSVSGSTGAILRVEVDSKHEEPWLRLSPPSARLNAYVSFPVPAIESSAELGFGQVKVDQNGIDFPKAAIVQPKFSIHCPHFTASDPRLEIDFSRSSLSLGVKLTPPFPGIPSHLVGNRAAALQMLNIPNLPLLDTQIRYDNLFLHLGHIYVEVEGGFNATGVAGSNGFLLGAEGNVVALEDTQIARCRGELAIADWEIQKLTLSVAGDLRPKGLSIGGVNGELLYLPRNNVQLRGSVDLAGYDVKGTLNYLTKRLRDRDIEPTALLELDTKARLPVVGMVNLNGRTSTAFDDYRLTASGAISVPLTVKEIHYRLDAVPGDHDFDWWWYTPDGREIHYKTKAPRGDLIDEEELREELYKMVSLSLDPTIVQPCPVFLLKDAVEYISGSGFKPMAGPRPNGDDAEGTQESFEIEDAFRSPILMRIEGDDLVVGSAGPPFVEFGKLNLREKGFQHAESVFRYGGWIDNNRIWVQLTEFTSHEAPGRFVQTIFRRDGQLLIDSFRVSDQVKKLVEDLNLLNRSSWSTRKHLAYDAISASAKYTAMFDSNFTVDEHDGDVFVVSSLKPTDPVAVHTFSANATNQRVQFYLPINARKAAIEAFGAGIPGIDNEIGETVKEVIAFNGDLELPRCAVIQAISLAHYRLIFGSSENIAESEIRCIGGTPISEVRTMAARIARSFWSGTVSTNGTFYVGPAGICQADTSSQNGWRLAPTSREAGDEAEFVFVSRNALELALDDNIGGDDLPFTLTEVVPANIDFQTIPTIELAKQAVDRWEALRVEESAENCWKAHPMVVLLKIAELSTTAK